LLSFVYLSEKNLERLFGFLEEKTEDCTGGQEPAHQSEIGLQRHIEDGLSAP
jgi:hypothetical protein